MPVSATTARVSMVVSEAVTLNQATLDQVYAGVKGANATDVTIDLPWATIQPTATTWNWTGADLAINRAFAAGLTVTVVLAPPPPSWSNVSRLDDTQFAAFAAAAAARYKPKGAGLTTANAAKAVTDWQLWHYPNVATTWPWLPNPAQYTECLKIAAPKIRAANAANKIIFGSLHPCDADLRPPREDPADRGLRSVWGLSRYTPQLFLNLCYRAGAKRFFDAVSYTPLSLPSVSMAKPPAPSGDSIKQSDKVRQEMLARTDSALPMYWTVGYDVGYFTPTQQAYYLDTLRRFAEARKDHVGRLTVHAYRD